MVQLDNHIWANAVTVTSTNRTTYLNAKVGTSNTNSTTNSYETTLGIGASTTGNIYGIYDMSGGSHEYVMGISSKTIGSSGFSSLPDEKYYNNYTSSSYTGHALTETSGWYNDYLSFVTTRGIMDV